MLLFANEGVGHAGEESRVTIGGEVLDAGDYLFTTAGEEHDVVAVSDALIFVSSQKETPVVGI